MTIHIKPAAAALGWVAAAVLLQSSDCRAADCATRVIGYCPAPGQFANLEITTDVSGALGEVSSSSGGDPATEGIVSLGAFGGYIVLGFDRPIKNDPAHRYGVDFTVVGNAISSGGGASCEPGAVQVMKDLNGNGVPDDGEWYELAGSDYWLASTRRNVTQSYVNPVYTNAHAVTWTASDGVTGAVLPVDAHTQPYYPDPFLFPEIPMEGYTLSGNRIAGAVDRRNPTGVTFYRAPGFGYADAHGIPGGFDGRFPNNPYYDDVNGPKTDGFDLSWAVDSEGNHVELDEVDFVRIYTAGNGNLGWLGEWSTEIDGVVLSEPDPEYVPTDYYLHYMGVNQALVAVGATARFEGILFRNGIPTGEGSARYSVDDPAVGSISADGVFTATGEGHTKVRFSQRDGVPEDVADVWVVSLTGVVAGTGTSASAVATANCVEGESVCINVESTCNYEELFPGAKGNRYVFDTYTWFNSNPAVGTVDSYGTFTAIAPGTTVLTACSGLRPDLYAEIQVTVAKIPPVVLNKTSVVIPENAPSGNWSAATLFKTTNRSGVTILSAEARYGFLPFELRGNRIVYDCSSSGNFSDILDMGVTHYGVTHSFSLPVSFEREEASVTGVDAGEANLDVESFEVLDVAGRVVATGAGASPCDMPGSGIYVVRSVRADGSVVCRKVVRK